MSKSYKQATLAILKNVSVEYMVSLSCGVIPVYTVNRDIMFGVIDFEKIISDAKLKGKTKPIAIIQYATVLPGTNTLIPMIAFVWSWGGPWAYIYNPQFPSWSEAGSVPLQRLQQFAGFRFPEEDIYFMSRE